MTEQRDPVLESMFAVSQPELTAPDGQAFTARVMAKTRKLVYGVAAVLVILVLLVLTVAFLLGVPVQDVARQITQALATTLIDFGEGWIAWILTPVNNVASLLVLVGKIIRVAWKKAHVASL
jgi:hypothetical protein